MMSSLKRKLSIDVATVLTTDKHVDVSIAQ